VSGRLFKTSEELTKCLESVLLDPEYAASLAVSGRQIAASLSTEKFGEMAEKLYLGLLEKTIEIEGDTDRSAVFL
jgi:hypothetical protein